MNVAALLPAYAAEHHPGLSAAMNGVLLAVYQVTFFISAPIVGLYMGLVGRKNCIGYGVIALSLATGMFSMAALFTHQWNFYWFSCFARGLQGIGDGMAYITIVSVTSLEFPENNEVY